MESHRDTLPEIIRVAFDTLPVNVAILDTDGTILWTNEAWDSFAREGGGNPATSGVGVNYLEAAAARDEYAERAVDGLRAVLDGEREEFTMEYPCHTPEREQWFLMWTAPFEADGKQYATVAHFDVTGRVLAEREVTERAEEVSTQRDHLALLNRIVRHDIRNDVQLVRIHAELLEDEVPEAEREHVDRVLRQVTHIVDLTEAVRDLESVITGENEPPLSPISLGAVLRSEIDKVRSAYEIGSTAVTVTGVGDLPHETEVLANGMLSSVFGNLLTNAVVHNRSEDAHVDVAVTRGEDTVEVVVADDGPGIPEADRETVFGRGEKGLESPGTGLGLYLVDRLVDMYGGDVWITDSHLGGTAVHVELRLAD